MRVDRIRVQNYRNLADIDISLGPGTVIVGENRAGKSNLLRALRLVLDPTLPNSERELRPEDFWDGLSDGSSTWNPISAGEIIQVSVDLADFDDEPNVVNALADALLMTKPLRARMTYLWAPSEVASDGRNVYRWRIFGGESQESRIPQELRQQIYMTFLHALRDVESDIRNWRRSPLRALLQAAAEAASSGGSLDEVRAAMEQANTMLNALPSVQELSNQISSRTQQMVGTNQAIATELGVAPPDPMRLIRSMRIFIDGEAQRSLGSASLGSLNVLYLSLLQLGLDARLAEAAAAHVVVAVDEPEAHLHPHLQRLIFKELLHTGIHSRTMLVTTQSPYIASVADPRNLVILRSTATSTSASVARDAELSEAEWNDISRYLDATRAEIVFARRVILVEGYAEQVLIPSIASSMGIELDKLGVSVCSVHGTHFLSYVKFCQALHLPWIVLTDADETDDKGVSRGHRRGRRLIEPETGPLEDHGIFVGESTFEIDLFNVADTNRDAFCQVLNDLSRTEAQRTQIEAWINAGAPSEMLLDFVKLVGGKGRVAQRLASRHLVAPPYIKNALLSATSK
ncbi:ATP-dependent nuclease [Cryptosporangium japonicum]|uniref:ATP-dependent endonuclease n=1 Tax=Cryptosporangium japonicum TaxID=80872 RepID=A0ABP3EIN9_9ACTN